MTQEQIKALIKYDPETGNITRLKPTTNRQKEGDTLTGTPITFNKKQYSTTKIIWLYIHGSYDFEIITLDGTTDYTLTNLLKVGSLNTKNITQKTLKKFVKYDETTGIFTWIAKTNKNTIIGDTIGRVDGVLPNEGYVGIHVLNNTYRAHRLAWLYTHGVFPPFQIDHIDHNRENNKLANLRLATHELNMKNKSLYITNKSGHSGISLDGKMWKARIGSGESNGKILLGMFETKAEAVAARKGAERALAYHKNHGV